MGLILRTAVLTDLGLRRANNEDAAYTGDRLFAVADGMGGLPAGELASELAIQALARLEQPPEEGAGPAAGGAAPGGAAPAGLPLDGPAAGGAALDGPAPAGVAPAGAAGSEQDGPVAAPPDGGVPDELVGALRAAFEDASDRIRAAAAMDEVRDGMGTTATALLFGPDRVALMHIGDSRGYLLRGGQLVQLTRDDTFVQALVDQGVLTAEDARRHPQRSLVTKAMQGRPIAPYGAIVPIYPGDLFLLCSDGLSDVVTDDVIGEVLRSRLDLDGCAARLVAAAVDGGGPDNVTVLLVEVQATG